MDRMVENFFGRGDAFGRQGGMFGDPFFQQDAFNGPEFTRREVRDASVRAAATVFIASHDAPCGAIPAAAELLALACTLSEAMSQHCARSPAIM